MADLRMKQGDTSPLLDVTLLDGVGNPIDLSGCAVTLRMKRPSGAVVERTMTLSSTPTDGRVTRVWDAQDTSEAGLVACDFKIVFADGTIRHVPTVGAFALEVVALQV